MTTTFERATALPVCEIVPHTPGPWIVERDGNGELAPFAGRTGQHLLHSESRIPLDHREANGTLMAAAPDMLTALRALVAECRAHLDYEDDHDMETACEAAEAAIAAATGAR